MIIRIIADILLVVGGFFALSGVIGIMRMPDAYCRMQSSTNISTLGLLGVALGGAVYSIFILKSSVMTVKIIAIGVFTLVTNPIGGHAICRAAYRHGIRPDSKMAVDEYGRDNPDE